MEKHDVLSLLRDFLSRLGYQNLEGISEKTSLSRDLGLCGIRAYLLVNELNCMYDIVLPDDVYDQIDDNEATLGDLVDAAWKEICVRC